MIKWTMSLVNNRRMLIKPCLSIMNRNFAHAPQPHDESHHHDDHKPAGPYDPPHPHVNDHHAYAPGMSSDYKYEGWEFISFGVVIICGAILYFVPQMTGHETLKVTFPLISSLMIVISLMRDVPKDWAKREALAREKVRAQGVEIEFGKYYQGVTFKENDELGGIPIEEGAEQEE
jgi:hypothetical protein